MTISASLVKELRERTGVSMMDCKKALVATNGDIEAAIEHMRKNGMAKAAKKADRTAAEGIIMVKASDDGKKAIIVEINSETDFVARDENFTSFANKVAAAALEHGSNDVASLMEQMVDGASLTEHCQQLIAKIGEKIDVRRVQMVTTTDSTIGHYTHGGRIGVVTVVQGGDAELAKDLSMHIAAMRPTVVTPDQVSADLVAKEKEIFTEQALKSGKPAEIVEKMIGGRINKFLDEVSLTGQMFVKDPSVKIANLLKQKNASVDSFVCYEVGEGIEKKVENFRDEVMAQVKGNG